MRQKHATISNISRTVPDDWRSGVDERYIDNQAYWRETSNIDFIDIHVDEA